MRGKRLSGHGELHDSVKNLVAKLYVLRDSCAGIIHSEKCGENLGWFQGAEDILEEAVDELQAALLGLAELTSTKEKEGKHWAYVERLIRKLDNSTAADLKPNPSMLSLDTGLNFKSSSERP